MWGLLLGVLCLGGIFMMVGNMFFSDYPLWHADDKPRNNSNKRQ